MISSPSSIPGRTTSEKHLSSFNDIHHEHVLILKASQLLAPISKASFGS